MPIMFYDTSREGIVIRVFDDTGGREVLLSARELRLRYAFQTDLSSPFTNIA